MTLRRLTLCLALLPLPALAQEGDVQTKQYDDGGVYEGTFKDGVQHGMGTYKLPNGYEYTGQWEDGEIKGEGICCFVTLKVDSDSEELKAELIRHVREQIGALATPDQIRFATALPKTRSGKIMRRLLRDIAAGREQVGEVLHRQAGLVEFFE